MNVNKKDLADLKAMLEEYKRNNGSISITNDKSTNYVGCSKGGCNGYCSGTCMVLCTYKCAGKCDGNLSFCLKLR